MTSPITTTTYYTGIYVASTGLPAPCKTALQTDTYNLDSRSSSGWAILLATSPITLNPQTSTTVQVRVDVPLAAANGMSDTTVITATSPNAHANAVDATAVITGDVADISVGKWAEKE